MITWLNPFTGLARLTDGSVRLVSFRQAMAPHQWSHPTQAFASALVFTDQTFEPDAWAQAIAGVSPRSDQPKAFYEARRFHMDIW